MSNIARAFDRHSTMNKTTTYIVAGLLPCLIGDPILGVACPQVSGTPKVAILESPFQTEALGLASGVIATHQPGDFASQFLELTASQTSLEPSPPGDVLKIETREGRNALELEVEDIIGNFAGCR